MGQGGGKKKTPREEQEAEKKKKGSPKVNAPPKRIKRDDTKEMFPYLQIENSEQQKLYKLAESIGGLAHQYMEDNKGPAQPTSNSQERLEMLK
mmetsp:Transcript_42287/g.30960  ORF Transcript_42287/g.30960 Transcript_42287/m.30960 type:complete len:93 (-) Transcript_42287:403-681(-)